MNPKATVDGHARYKITKTVTGPDGKTHTETIEMIDEDALRLMRTMHMRSEDAPKNERFTVSSLAKSNTRSRTGQTDEEFAQEALKVHNDFRYKHGVEPLRLNNDLTKLAQQWANHLASTGSLVHSRTKYRNGYVGENLYCQSCPMTGREMTEAWYSEGERYHYQDRRSYQSGTGHFTQLIWKNSEEVGFAQAQGSSMNFAVAMYYPAGNFLGEYAQNVFPPQ